MSATAAISKEIVTWVGNRTMLNAEARKDLQAFIENRIAPLMPEPQRTLDFAGDDGLKGQSLAILKLLKERRSAGAYNYELAEISLKYTGRISDLRAAGWKIDCERVGGSRTTLYRLSPTDW